jgi:hypothetical protein
MDFIPLNVGRIAIGLPALSLRDASATSRRADILFAPSVVRNLSGADWIKPGAI